MCNKVLYLECYSGISGDMTVASLIDLGVDPSVLTSALDSLDLKGYSIEISRVNKAQPSFGISIVRISWERTSGVLP